MKIVFFLAIASFTAYASTATDAETTLPPLCNFDVFSRSVDCTNAGLEDFPKVDPRTRKL